MPQAQITINAVAGSNTDLPINTLVQLNNNNIGGETTYTWALLDIPAGSTATLSNPAIQNPTFTPDVEGSYLIQLIVNATLPSEVSDVVVAAVRQIKTRIRIPAAGESNEADSTDGWSVSVNSILQLVDAMRADPGLRVAQLNSAGTVAGDTVRFDGVGTLLSGLPGQQTIGQVIKVTGLDPEVETSDIFYLIGGVDGSGTPTIGDLVYIRWAGVVGPLTGAPVVGAQVYVSDIGNLSLVAGTLVRSVGKVIYVSGGSYWLYYDSVTHEVANALSTAPLLTNGPAPAVLVNAVDVTDLMVPQQFVATAVVSPQNAVPIALRWDSGVAGAAGDKVTLPFVLNNDSPSPSAMAEIVAEVVSPVAGAEESKVQISLKDGLGTSQSAAVITTAGVELPISVPQTILASNSALTLTGGGGDLLADSVGDNAALRTYAGNAYSALEHVGTPVANITYTESMRVTAEGVVYFNTVYDDSVTPLLTRTDDYRIPIKVWTPALIPANTSLPLPTFTPPNGSNGIIKLVVLAHDSSTGTYFAEVWQRWVKNAGVVVFPDPAYLPQATYDGIGFPTPPWTLTAGGANLGIALQNPVGAPRSIKLSGYIQILTNAWEV